MPKRLEKQQHTWRAVLDLTKEVQPYFGGRTGVSQTLPTDSLEMGQPVQHQRFTVP
jgi:hypothetical protein